MSNNLIRLRQIPLSPIGALANDVVIYIRFSRERTDSSNYFINAQGNQVDLNPELGPTISTIWYRLQIEDIDRTTGLVRISGILDNNGNPINNIPDDNVIYKSDKLEAFYFYQELDLVFNKISLNPIFNRQLLTTGISIYIKPIRSTIGGVTQPSSLSVTDYLLFDENENILFASDPAVPQAGSVDSFFTTLPNDLELARIFVRNTAVVRDITDTNLVDTRIVGGRLIDPLPQEIIDIINANTNGMYYLRDWDGIVMPGNSVVVIKLPLYILNDTYKPTGTRLTGTALTARMIDVRRACKKHIAAGILPIVRFYDQFGNIHYDLNPPLDRVYF
jgi:hypothetical protein